MESGIARLVRFLGCVTNIFNQFGAMYRVLEEDPKAKKLLQHFKSMEFVVWGAILHDTWRTCCR